MYHLLQENLFREVNHTGLVNALTRLDLEYEVIKLRPFVEDVPFVTERKDVMVWGAVKLARLANKYGFTPGSFLNESHDYDVYSKYYKDHLLNYDSDVIAYSDTEYDYPYQFFARPTKDSKAFNGKVYTKEEFLTMKGILKRNNWVKEDFNIQIASLKRVSKEIRFWIVGGEIITASLYVLGGKYYIDDRVDEEAYTFVNQMLKLFQLADAFVMDVCLFEGQWKIME